MLFIDLTGDTGAEPLMVKVKVTHGHNSTTITGFYSDGKEPYPWVHKSIVEVLGCKIEKFPNNDGDWVTMRFDIKGHNTAGQLKFRVFEKVDCNCIKDNGCDCGGIKVLF